MTDMLVQLASHSRDDLRGERVDGDDVAMTDGLARRLELLYKGLISSSPHASSHIYELHYVAVHLTLILRAFILSHTADLGRFPLSAIPGGSGTVTSPGSPAPIDRAASAPSPAADCAKTGGGGL